MTTAITPSAAGTTPATQPAQPGRPATGLSSDFETFLKMLTAQARYQDPLEPIDSTEYAAQLAQFSMVEQQVQTNDALSLLSGQLSLSNMSGLANWVGMEARAVMPAYFDGTTPVTIAPNPAAVADEVYLVVKNETGTEVQRSAIPVSADPVQWVGTDAAGASLPAGTYSFTVESYADDDLILTEPAQVYARVTEAQARDGQILLMFPGGEAVISTAVTALREAR